MPTPFSRTPTPSSVGADVAAPLERVWAVVVDPRTYPLWLVGAQRIRGIDEGWPTPGTAFHHTVGWTPLRLADRTEVVSVDPERELVLRAHLSALGSATVTIHLEEQRGVTHVDLSEAPHDGLIGGLWHFGARHAMRLGLWGRNGRSLQRLASGIEDGVIIGHVPAGPA